MRSIAYIAIMIALISLASLSDARSIERAAPQTASDDAFVHLVCGMAHHEFSWDKSLDGSLWVYVDGVMLVKNNENVTAIWGLKAPDTPLPNVPYQLVTDDLVAKTQAFTDAVNSTELRVQQVENPHRAEGYWFFFKQELPYNGTLGSIEGPVMAMREHLQVVSANTAFRNLIVSDEWFWDSERQWLGSSWAR